MSNNEENLIRVDIPQEAFCVFCEEIRTEINEKSTYIGVYGRELYVDTFPYTFDKLSLALNIRWDMTAFPKVLTARIAYEGKQDVMIPPMDPSEKIKNTANENETVQLRVHIKCPPIEISKEGDIEVMVRLDNSFFSAGTMTVKKRLTKRVRKPKAPAKK